MIGNRKQLARLQSDFYRDNYYKILNALLFSSVIILLLIVAIIYVILFEPGIQYYASTIGGQIVPITPVVTK